MNTIAIRIVNPFVSEHAGWTIYEYHKELTKNFSLETEITGYDPKDIFTFNLSIRDNHMDHRGMLFELSFIGFGVIIEFYDRRHKGEYHAESRYHPD